MMATQRLRERLEAIQVKVLNQHEEIARLRVEGGIAADLVGKIAEMVGARPVFASHVLSQEELLTAVRKLTSPSAPAGWQPIDFLKGLITKLHDGAQRCERSGLPEDLRTLWRGKAIAYETILGAIGQLLEGQNAKDALPPSSSGWQAKAAASLRDLVKAMRDYEMDVEESAPYRHREMMARAEALLKDALPPAPDASPAQDPIAAAVDAQLDPLKDELVDIGHKLAKEPR